MLDYGEISRSILVRPENFHSVKVFAYRSGRHGKDARTPFEMDEAFIEWPAYLLEARYGYQNFTIR
jgi:hypothetical protein